MVGVWRRTARELGERLASLKMRLFGTKDLILHTADICRNRNGFERLCYPSFRRNPTHSACMYSWSGSALTSAMPRESA